MTIWLVYTWKSGWPLLIRNHLWQLAKPTIDDSEMLLTCGGFTGHIEKEYLGYEGIYGGYGFGSQNVDS